MSVEEEYVDFMLTWAVQEEWGIIKYELVPYTTAKEEHHIIAKAANKYYGLVALNDSPI